MPKRNSKAQKQSTPSKVDPAKNVAPPPPPEKVEPAAAAAPATAAPATAAPATAAPAAAAPAAAAAPTEGNKSSDNYWLELGVLGGIAVVLTAVLAYSSLFASLASTGMIFAASAAAATALTLVGAGIYHGISYLLGDEKKEGADASATAAPTAGATAAPTAGATPAPTAGATPAPTAGATPAPAPGNQADPSQPSVTAPQPITHALNNQKAANKNDVAKNDNYQGPKTRSRTRKASA